jgi:hypothetical protein
VTACEEKLVAIGVPANVAEKLCSSPVGTQVCVRTATGKTCYSRKRPVYVEKES